MMTKHTSLLFHCRPACLSCAVLSSTCSVWVSALEPHSVERKEVAPRCPGRPASVPAHEPRLSPEHKQEKEKVHKYSLMGAVFNETTVVRYLMQEWV